MADAKRYYPVFLDLDRRPAVVIGAGEAAERKARQLVRYGADVTVITPAPSPQLLADEGDGLLTIENRGYVRGDLEGAFIAMCVTDDEEVRRGVYGEAEAIGCLVNTMDVPDLCSFIVPSVVNREPLQIAVSTGGVAPGLAKQVKREIAATYGPEWGAYAGLLGEVRMLVYGEFEDPEQRAAILEAVATSDALERLKAGETLSARELIDRFAPKEPASQEDDE